MTNDKQQRKERPIARGVLSYFPDAIAEVAHVSFVGNAQHNPGQPMHWTRGKSDDHADCLARHLIERGTIDTDGLRHSAKAAWRALAMLQIEIEAADYDERSRIADGCGRCVSDVGSSLSVAPKVEAQKFFDHPERERDFKELIRLGCPDQVARPIVMGTTYVEGDYAGTKYGSVSTENCGAPDANHSSVQTTDGMSAVRVLRTSGGSDIRSSESGRQGVCNNKEFGKYAVAENKGGNPEVRRDVFQLPHDKDAGEARRQRHAPYAYVAGPMRGLPGFNFPAFDEARDMLVQQGYNVISPADIDRAAEDTDEKAAKAADAFRDFWALYFLSRINQGQNSIVVLRNYERSTGATAEYGVAKWLGLKLREIGEFARPEPEEYMLKGYNRIYRVNNGVVEVAGKPDRWRRSQSFSSVKSFNAAIQKGELIPCGSSSSAMSMNLSATPATFDSAKTSATATSAKP